jgi:biopolymer transport protein ExbB
MKQGVFITILMVVAFAIAYVIFEYMLPDYIKAGGPLVILLITMSLMVVTFIFERLLALNKAKGKGSLTAFLRKVQGEIAKENITGAIDICDKQRGSCANVLRAGLEKYNLIKTAGTKLSMRDTQEDIQKAIEESMMLEVPLLEKNLVALSTIASIATLTGLLGTTLGMIRAFKALAKSGAPDAIALSLGISEALVNTAGGLFCAILGIVFYNYFVTRIDNFTYMIDEATVSMVTTLAEKQAGIK